MLKQIKYIGILLAGSIAFSGCEKVIDVKLNNAESQLVIEGNITDQAGTQVIRISKSVPYSEPNAFPPVKGALVNVTDDHGHSWNFLETSPGTYAFGPLKGEAGYTYSLKVNADSKTYTATSVMPAPVQIDSLDVKVFHFGNEDQKQVQVHYKDPGGIANQYRFILKVNGYQSQQVYAENDRLTDGNKVPSVLFFEGRNKDDNKVKPGDQVEVEMQCIDKDMYTYWFTLSQQAQNGPGGGVTPGNPPSNIRSNSLGYFSAHTVSKKQMTVK